MRSFVRTYRPPSCAHHLARQRITLECTHNPGGRRAPNGRFSVPKQQHPKTGQFSSARAKLERSPYTHTHTRTHTDRDIVVVYTHNRDYNTTRVYEKARAPGRSVRLGGWFVGGVRGKSIEFLVWRWLWRALAMQSTTLSSGWSVDSPAHCVTLCEARRPCA